MELDGDWEVALSEILFQRTCYNIQEDECMLRIITPATEIDMLLRTLLFRWLSIDSSMQLNDQK